jgi:hypothetical protein
MKTEISYRGDNTKRRAINDLIRWFGLSKSKLIIREVRKCRTMGDLDGINIAIAFGGCEGEPVRRLFAHIHGEDALARWIKSTNNSPELI